jgi:hypothetical protein
LRRSFESIDINGDRRITITELEVRSFLLHFMFIKFFILLIVRRARLKKWVSHLLQLMQVFVFDVLAAKFEPLITGLGRHVQINGCRRQRLRRLHEVNSLSYCTSCTLSTLMQLLSGVGRGAGASESVVVNNWNVAEAERSGVSLLTTVL